MATLVLRAFREGSHFQSLTSVASKISTSSQSSSMESSTCVLFSSPISVGFADKIEKFRVPSLVQSLRAVTSREIVLGRCTGNFSHCSSTKPTREERSLLREKKTENEKKLRIFFYTISGIFCTCTKTHKEQHDDGVHAMHGNTHSLVHLLTFQRTQRLNSNNNQLNISLEWSCS